MFELYPVQMNLLLVCLDLTIENVISVGIIEMHIPTLFDATEITVQVYSYLIWLTNI